MKHFISLEELSMKEGLLGNEAFFIGMSLGIALYQHKAIAAYERGQLLLINEELYYLQTGKND